MANKQTGPAAFAGQVDLARSDLGGKALACSDDFFAGVENLIRAEEPVFDPNAYTERGKEMDGWESRRRRTPGHDWAIVKLGVVGEIRGVDIHTAFFLGNHPPYGSLEACNVPEDTSVEVLRTQTEWTEIVPTMPLQRGSHNLQAVSVVGVWSHVRLRMYPDGGVARLRVYGTPQPPVTAGEVTDVACITHGGRAIACSDMFFSPMNNLILPTKAPNMGGGWETRRSRPPGMDWIVVELGQPSMLQNIVVDTAFFKGNFPDTVAIDGLYWPKAPTHEVAQSEDWREIVPQFPTRADAKHSRAVQDAGPFTHVRLRIYPDGGVSRMRVMGRPTSQTPADSDARLQWLNSLPASACVSVLQRCCGALRWATQMAAARPFTSWTHLHGVARWIWWRLDDADWQEAFTHHPEIGANRDALRQKFAQTANWSAAEQSGVQGADEAVLSDLVLKNAEYKDRFGYIFIVCATGLRAEEMRDRLCARLPNAPANEIRIAAGEQAKITALRLNKLEAP